jgi:hypothetical protein
MQKSVFETNGLIIEWIRGIEYVSFNKPHVFFITGIRGSGKSSFLELIATKYLDNGHAVFDLFGSKDGENLAWLRSPYAEDKKILLIKGENVDVSCSWNVKTADLVTLSDFENNDVILSSSPLYSSLDQEYLSAAKLTDLLYKRISWSKIVYCIVREAANLYYSRLKISEDQTQAKAYMIYLLRESRHMGLALGLDSLRWHAIDIDVRSLSDFLVFKNLGQLGFTKEMKWLYYYVQPEVMRKLKPNNFIILTKKGSIGVGCFSKIEWHKREGENILKELGIRVEYAGEAPRESVDKGAFKTVSDHEHAEIIRLYIEEKLGMDKIAEKLNRSPRTINIHTDKHDMFVRKNGYCHICHRVKSPYFDKLCSERMVNIYRNETPTLKASNVM